MGRRRFIIASAAAGATALAGCSTERTTPTPPDPVSLASDKQCDVCGMVIDEHPGPTGQIFYRDDSPETHENPAWFDALQACLFPYYFDHQRLDWTAEAVYVTDYSAVEYEIWEAQGQRYIEETTAPETFAVADEVTYVAGSDVHGAMGPELIPFSEAADAESFAGEHGGETMAMDDITPETLASGS